MVSRLNAHAWAKAKVSLLNAHAWAKAKVSCVGCVRDGLALILSVATVGKVRPVTHHLV